MKNNQQEIKLEPRQQKAIAMSTPKGFIKSQPYIIPEKEVLKNSQKIMNNNHNNDDKEEYKKLENEKFDDEKSNGIQTVPPKPLPRVSRTNSLTDEEPKPVARPRTTPNPNSIVTSVNPNNVGGYKVGCFFWVIKFS